MNNLDILIETLHTLLCPLPHNGTVEQLITGRKPGVCYYYAEKSVSTGKQMPDHTYWHDQALETIKTLSAQDANSALTSIYRALDFVEKFDHLNKSEQKLALKLMGVEDD